MEAIKSKKHTFFKIIFNESKLFIIFSFLVCLLPIFLSLIGSLIQPNGSQAVLAIGYVAPFLMAFIQISFSISMIVIAKLKNQANEIKDNTEKLKNDHLNF